MNANLKEAIYWRAIALLAMRILCKYRGKPLPTVAVDELTSIAYYFAP